MYLLTTQSEQARDPLTFAKKAAKTFIQPSAFSYVYLNKDIL